MSGTCLLAVILVCITLIAICAFGIALLFFYNKHKNIMESLTAYEIDVNADINSDIPKILDAYVSEIFNDYRVKNLEPNQKIYYNQDDEMNIIKDLSSLCGDRLSPAMANKLSLFWSPETIGSVIADKVYLVVVNYVANHNTVHNTQEANLTSTRKK